jgi:hypothetical protein
MRILHYYMRRYPGKLVRLIGVNVLGMFPCLLSATPAEWEVGTVSIIVNMRTSERGVVVPLTWKSGMAERVRASRVVIDRAEDNLGVTLVQKSPPRFYHETAGRIEGDGAMRSSKQPLSFRLSGASALTTTLRSVEGTIEAIIPENDPASVVMVEQIGSHLGKQIISESLVKAGVEVIVFDRATKPTWMIGGWGENPIGVSVVDPEHRIVGMEFQAADGGALTYNHNGDGHSGGGAAGVGIHSYTIDRSALVDAKFVCWLITEKSLVRFPLKLTELPLRKSPQSPPLPPYSPPSAGARVGP